VTRRTRQVGELLKEELTDIIRKEVKDPRIGFMSITDVDVTPDLRQARVYVSVLHEEERQGTMDALISAASFIRHHLKPRLRMRQIPFLEFRGDRSMEYAQHITETLREIQRQDAERGAAVPAPDSEPPTEGEPR
jgi:ribosome-binding factor A